MIASCRLLAVCSIAIAAMVPSINCADETVGRDEIPLIAPKNWRGETIQVPPGFAKDMKLTGTEKIRFAPGMFKSDADDFFTYVLVFRLKPEPELTAETLQRELLVYYRGLAAAVSEGKIKTEGFTYALKKLDGDSQEKATANYAATLKWIEPFVTAEPQTLNFELRVWKSEKGDHNWVFMAVSPNDSDAPIWKTMHQIRDKFLTAVKEQ